MTTKKDKSIRFKKYRALGLSWKLAGKLSKKEGLDLQDAIRAIGGNISYRVPDWAQNEDYPSDYMQVWAKIGKIEFPLFV